MIPFKMVVVDLETTGNSPKRGEKIIQFSAVTIENGSIIDQYTSFVNPGIEIPPFIEELTGINDDMVKDAPYFEDIAPKILTILDGAVFVAHNVQFDLSFLQGELEEAGYNPFTGPAFDTVELAKIVIPSADSYKLSDLSNQLNLSHVRPHQADSDAYVTAEILTYFIELLCDLPFVTLSQLEKLSKYLKSELSLLFDSIIEYKKVNLEDLPSQYEVYRGIALLKKVEMEEEDVELPFISDKLSEANFEAFIQNSIQDYEKRDSQLEMMGEVYQGFDRHQHVVIEAGTGIGKSMGYLLPSVLFSKKNGVPIVISTYTVQLQAQLIYKEIQTLKQMFPAIRTALLKGKNHYINLFKFEQTLQEEDAQYDAVITKMQILVWLTQTQTGDVDELNLSSGGQLYWNRIRHDGWHLKEKKDPWIGRDFYLQARKKALKADLIITNHSMLLTDMISEQKLLPAYDYLVIDEAHHLEKSARSQFGIVLDYISMKFIISQLGTLEQKQLLFKLENVLEAHNIAPHMHSFELDYKIQEFYRELEDGFHMISTVLLKVNRSSLRKIQVRLTKEFIESSKWQPIVMIMERVIAEMKSILTEITKRLDLIKEKETDLKDYEKAVIEEMYSFLLEWSSIKDNLQTVFVHFDNQQVIWFEGDNRSLPNSLKIQSQPIAVDSLLYKHLFSETKSIILTSATLTVHSSFDYFLREIGIDDADVKTVIYSSPFNYKENARLYVPNDIPDIQGVSFDEYVESISSHLIGVAQATKGRMLILFTAYDMLRRTYELMKDSGLLEDYILLAQGITSGSRTRLTKNFQRFDKAILFGTSSFWEGVDIPGEDLSCLAMVRLPFSPPNEPVTEARSQLAKSQGKNPFTVHSLPEAVIRFKQGIGRLIRRSSDKGIIIVYDRRIISSKYGSAFLESIPLISVSEESLDSIIESIENWL